MKKQILIGIFAFCLLMTINACKKEGPAGAAGKDGNANVKSSTVTVTNWSFSSPSYYTDISWGVLTTDMVNNGAVFVYASTGTNTWSQLPLTIYPSSNYSSTLEVVTSPGNVRIIWTDSDLTQPANPGQFTFKIVAIAASQRLANPDVDYTNYNEVKARYNLEE
ncbi:MAG: hypothetical protein ABIQ40_05705 [Bacteroidia bacterium]